MEIRYAPLFRVLGLLAVMAFGGLAFIGWMAYRVERAALGLVVMWPCLLIGLYWLVALAAAPQTVRFDAEHLTIRRWLGRRTLTYANITAVHTSYALITLKTVSQTVRLHKLFANDDAILMQALETYVPVAQQARATRLARALPIVLTGRGWFAPLFTALSGLGLLAFGPVATSYALTSSAEPDVAQRLVVGALGVLSIGLGLLCLYWVLWAFPHRTVFTTEAFTQYFLMRTTTQSMRAVVDFQLGYDVRPVRGIARRLYTITLVYGDGATFKWIPNEFYFPMDYPEAAAAHLAAELAEQLRRAYLSPMSSGADAPSLDKT